MGIIHIDYIYYVKRIFKEIIFCKHEYGARLGVRYHCIRNPNWRTYFIILFEKLICKLSFWIIGASCGVVSIYWLIMNRNSFVFSIEPARSDFKRNYSFGKWIFIGSTISIVSVQIYPWLLTSYHGTAITGTLAAYLGIVGLSNPFAYAVGNFLLPSTTDIYYTYGIEGLRKSVRKATILIGFIMILFCLLIYVTGSKLVIIFYGVKICNQFVVLVLLALSASIIVISSPFSAALYALDKPKTLFRIDIASF